MRAEHVNTFLESARRIITAMCGREPSMGRAFLRQEPYQAEEVSVLIGVTGSLRGQFIITMKGDTAKGVASQMMGGMPVAELDEIGLSAIGELGNMVAGNASTAFAEMGVNIDITPPTILEGSRIKISSSVATLAVPMQVNLGTIELALSLAD